MRFAICAMDRYLGVFEAFIRAGWTPIKVFTVPVANGLDSHLALGDLARRHDVPVQFEKIGDSDLRGLGDEGCDALIVACYPWRVGAWQNHIRYAVNFHNSPLPEARGPYPVHRAILEGRRVWSMTCHQVEPEMDGGAIMASEAFPLSMDECHESFDLKAQMAAKRLAGRVAQDFVALWDQAQPQIQGDYWPSQRLEDRVIDFARPVERLMRQIRAFGCTQSLARVRDRWIAVERAIGWTEAHSHSPGSVIHVSGGVLVVAVPDGYIAVMEASLVMPETANVLETRILDAPPPTLGKPNGVHVLQS